MKYDPDFENAMIIDYLPVIESTIRPLHFMPREDMRSIALMSALHAIRSGYEEGEALAEKIRERIIEDLNEEKRKLREQGWSRHNLFSLDRRVSADGTATFLDWVRSPDRIEHIVLAREFRRSLSAEERAAAECLAYNCSLQDMGIRGEREITVRNQIRSKWIGVFGEKRT